MAVQLAGRANSMYRSWGSEGFKMLSSCFGVKHIVFFGRMEDLRGDHSSFSPIPI